MSFSRTEKGIVALFLIAVGGLAGHLAARWYESPSLARLDAPPAVRSHWPGTSSGVLVLDEPEELEVVPAHSFAMNSSEVESDSAVLEINSAVLDEMAGQGINFGPENAARTRLPSSVFRQDTLRSWAALSSAGDVKGPSLAAPADQHDRALAKLIERIRNATPPPALSCDGPAASADAASADSPCSKCPGAFCCDENACKLGCAEQECSEHGCAVASNGDKSDAECCDSECGDAHACEAVESEHSADVKPEGDAPPVTLQAPADASEIVPGISSHSPLKPSGKDAAPSQEGPSLGSKEGESARTPGEIEQEDRTRAIIAQELPEAREDERQIWFEELKGLPPGMIRELLRIRRGFRVENRPGATWIDVPHPVPPPIALKEHGPPAPPPPTNESDESSILIESSPSATSINGDDARLQTALAALRQAQQVILNNIANANTPGFKRSSVTFADLDYQSVRLPGAQDANGHAAPTGVAIGAGVQVSATSVDHAQGPLRHTGRSLDLSISGAGFFQLQDPSGQIVYTRAGNFTVNSDGVIVVNSTGEKRLLEPNITVPHGAAKIDIASDGAVSVLEPPNQTPTQLGQIQTVSFVNPGGLLPLGENLFGATDASGAPQVGTPGLEGRGKLRQGFREGSNVTLTEELAELKRLQQQMQAIEQAGVILSAPAAPPILSPGEQPAAGPIARRRLPSRTSEHTPPDRAKR